MSDKRTPKKVSKDRLYRAVASSSAIETFETVEAIEQKLKHPKPKFKGVRLQLAL